MTPAMGSLGEIVRSARAAKGLSLRATGQAAGVSFVTIRDIERGHVKQPARETLTGLAFALDIPLSTLAVAAYSGQEVSA